ncbi:MAG TPA: lysylphosphatidylglycerol synthase transmembrane domain-containing protein, partial [Chloroflexota bacterium]|nr:lysylphosphatidylglycerol synthase transmembrane domain-containing protein [Chloroflexota bacterium]
MTRVARWWRNPWLRYGVTFALLALIFWKAVDPRQLWRTMQHISPVNLGAAMALTIPFLFLKALRWHLLLRAGRCRATFQEAFISLIGGMGVALLTPARVGELVRAAYVSEPRKLRVGALVMVDKIYDVIVLALLSAAGAALLISPLLALALGAFGLAGVYLALRPRDLRTFYSLVGRRLPLYAKIDTVLAGFAEFRAGVGALCLLYTLGSFVVVLLQFWIILRASTAAA